MSKALTDGLRTWLPWRYFRFSIRTLFVAVTAVGIIVGWLVYQVNWLRQRRAIVNDPKVQATDEIEETVIFRKPSPHGIRFMPPYRWQKAPWQLRWLGEKGYTGILLDPSATDDEVAHVRTLFPEALCVGKLAEGE